jgi:hypothetical protein
MPISQINTNSIANGAVVAADLAAGAALSNLGTSQLSSANMPSGSVVNVTNNIPNGIFQYNNSAGTSQDMTAFDTTITPSSRANYFLVDATWSLSMVTQGNAGIGILENSSGSYNYVLNTAGNTLFNSSWATVAPSANQYVLMWYGFAAGAANSEEQRTIRGQYLIKLASTSGSSAFNLRFRCFMGETPPLYVNQQASTSTVAAWGGPSLSSITVWEIKP